MHLFLVLAQKFATLHSAAKTFRPLLGSLEAAPVRMRASE